MTKKEKTIDVIRVQLTDTSEGAAVGCQLAEEPLLIEMGIANLMIALKESYGKQSKTILENAKRIAGIIEEDAADDENMTKVVSCKTDSTLDDIDIMTMIKEEGTKC